MAFRGNLGEATVDVRLATDKLRQDLNKTKSTINSSLSQITSKMRTAGLGMTAALTAPLLLFGKSTVDAAAAAEEMNSKFNVVFGESAKEVEDWAATTGRSIQRSSSILKKAAADTQSLLLSAGLMREEATELSKSMTLLALDTASFNDAADDQALNAFQKALLGENEALKGVGLAIQQAEVEQELLNMGIKESWNQVTRANKALAVHQLLIKKTAQMHGDLERTSGSTTNQLKAFSSAMLDLKVTIGTQLLPVITPLVTMAKNLLLSIASLNPTTIQLGLIIAGVTATLGPLLLALSLLLTPLGAVTVAVGAVVAAFMMWDKIVEKVKETYNGVKEWVGNKLTGVLDAAVKPIEKVSDAFYQLWDDVVGHSYVPDLVDGIEKEFDRLKTVMVDPTDDATKKVSNSFKTMANGIRLDIRDLEGSFTSSFENMIYSQLNNQLNAMVSTPMNSIFGSIFSGLGFANGGRPPVGMASMVGERGPELFIPDQAGTIIPNEMLGGGGQPVSIVNNNNFTGVDSVNRAELTNALNQTRIQTLQQVTDLTRRGGAFRSAIRGE